MWTVRAYDIGETDAQLSVDLTEQLGQIACEERCASRNVAFWLSKNAAWSTRFESLQSGASNASAVNMYLALCFWDLHARPFQNLTKFCLLYFVLRFQGCKAIFKVL